MTTPHRIDQLEEIAQLILDVKLAELGRAARARQACLDRLRALDTPPAEGLDPVAAARANLRYQAWADRRRAEINLTLARETAEWSIKRDLASHAFARSEALRLLKQRTG